MSYAYYNDNDTNICGWLRQLIKNGLIADGEVDERSITDVEPADLRVFAQHHFFAGIGGWSYALRLAGWPDDRPVCTASLPCQPFSVAGAGKGKADERHLLPHFIELVKQCKFPVIFGEQVTGAIKHGWLDDLYVEMGRENYSVRAKVLTAAGVGAFHKRQRLYWVANANNKQRRRESFRSGDIGSWARAESGRSGGVNDGLSNCDSERLQGWARTECSSKFTARTDFLANNEWAMPDWLCCRDGKLRPIKSGLKPLVNGLSKGMVRSGDPGESVDADNTQEARVMRLKGYGNAIVPQVAASFITDYFEMVI